MKRVLRVAASGRRQKWLPIAAIALLSAACVGMGVASDSQAADGGKIWHDSPAGTKPVMPKGYQPLPSLSGLVKKLKPTVVNVYTTQVVKPKVRKRMQHPQLRDPFFEEFFGGRQFDPLERFFGLPQREYMRNSLGSGFIVSPEGYVLTNHHVVAKASEIKVKLADETTLEAKVVGSDEKTDIALLKVEPKGKLPYAPLGDSDDLEVGDWVVAIGNPFGLGHTVTAGIISAKSREIGHGPYDDFLQTDAAINPGNSGGPLFDTAGNVIGINTAIVPRGSGISFAVPVDLVKELLPQLHDKGKVVRGWLGVGIQSLTPALADQFEVMNKQGALVGQVFDDGPADRAGLRAGDIIVAIDGKPVEDVKDVTTRIAALPPGSKAEIEVLRDGDRETFRVELGEREQGEALASGEGGSAGEATLGLTVAPLDANLARKLGVDEDLKGLVVREVASDSPAASVVQPRDIILEVNRKRVSDLVGFMQAVGDGKSVLIRIQRGQSQFFVAINKKTDPWSSRSRSRNHGCP